MPPIPMHTATRTEVRSSHLRAFKLPAYGGTERVALLPEQAVLLAGDHVEVSVRVAAGRALEIVEPGGTVAYAMRGRAARWDVLVEVEDSGSLVWQGQPFVVSEGADVRRTLRVDMARDSRVVLRETLVLGRSGQDPGRLVSRSEVYREAVPVLVEELDSAVGLGDHRVVDQVLELGVQGQIERVPPGGWLRGSGAERLRTSATADAMVLDSGDRLHRWLGAATHESPLQSSSPSAE